MAGCVVVVEVAGPRLEHGESGMWESEEEACSVAPLCSIPQGQAGNRMAGRSGGCTVF
jgi:hypothetical protein